MTRDAMVVWVCALTVVLMMLGTILFILAHQR